MVATHQLAASEAEFTFEAGPYSVELAVIGWQAEEALSRPFELEVELAAADDVEIDAAAVVGKDARLTIRLGGEEARTWSGIVARLGAWDAGGGAGRRRYRALVVPRLARLAHVQRCRIFQAQSVPDIVARVLGDGGVALRADLAGDHGARDYCVQYRESDLAFVSRLLEEEGITYFFEHGEAGDVVVLVDAPGAHPPIGGGPERLAFRPPDRMIPGEEAIEAITSDLRLCSGAVVLRDYAFVNPALDLDARAAAEGADPALEVYDYPGEYVSPAVGGALARVRLEELRADAHVLSGRSRCRRLVAGATFALEEHPGDLDGTYLVRSVRHVGRQPEVLPHEAPAAGEAYAADFVCQPAAVPFRPRRATPRPLIAGAQTAIVVGPAGEEIHPDAHGRVKVQFHWDREGRRDERSSCWVRVSQAWAGPGWGTLYLPRIGQEVVVEFLEGDPDRPIVTGRVYNGHNPPPVGLPGEKTRSTLRSSSSPGGGGANELLFEDAAGSELVYLHAQKDLSVAVENDKAQTVGGSETLAVTKDRTRSVGGAQSLEVGADDTSVIKGNQSLAVTKDRDVSVSGSHSEKITLTQAIEIGGSQTLTVGAGSMENVGLGKMLNVGGAYAVNVGGLFSENVAGAKIEAVGGARIEIVVGKKSESVKTGNKRTQIGGGLTEDIKKDHTLKTGQDVVVNVGGKLAVTAAKAHTIKAKEVTMAAEDELTITVGSVKLQFKKGGDAVMWDPLESTCRHASLSIL